MKAIILAAGKSTRTHPLTLTKPKPLLKVANKTLIEHNLEQLVDLVDEAILIVGYKKEMIKKHLGKKYNNIKLTYVEQKSQLGTGHAVMQVQKFIKKERFIIMMSDDLYFRGDMRRCLRYDLAVMAKRVENYYDFGVFVRKGERVLDIKEKPKEFVSDLANTGFYVLNEKVFDCLKNIKKSERGEYELTDAFRLLAEKDDIFSVEAEVWLPIGYPWKLLEADQIIRDEDTKIGKNTEIKGTVTESTIGNNCKIYGFVKNSVIGDNVIIHKNSVIEDSVIGDNVEFMGTIKTSPKTEIKIKSKNITVENFGAAIGDDSKLIEVLIQPGTLIWNNVKKKGKELKGVVKK
jgi:UDP-N-acetylglucosamine diphosphorylase / glucose-1-phosphate thymidylyltransferase / UDP-N-acetylgalactosamine diphosphorylase / glucosamine-1-phosphate N-acetyltransferase / galactosamine-1-phosphate N-acetyltransferase